MSALFAALDKKMENVQLGENMNQEYSWSTDIKELITQFYFQLTRTSETKILEDKYQELLKQIFNFQHPSKTDLEIATEKIIEDEYDVTTEILEDYSRVEGRGYSQIEYIKIIYKLIGQTRDIISGKGEYNLTYMMISGLYQFSQSNNCPEKYKLKIITMATCAIESLVRTELNEHPYGSWKDMKYFCNYHISKENRFEHKLKELNDPLFNKVIELIIGQLQCDQHAPIKTLLARWIPREKSEKFGWITPVLATRYYKSWLESTNPDIPLTDKQKTGARRKCLTHFRQLVSEINKKLNTPQINQCNNTWANIKFDNDVTSITLRKQYIAR